MKTLYIFLLAALLTASVGLAQNSKKKGATTRSVIGTVTTNDDKPVPQALVQLKNTKTTLILSFYTKDNGTYYFNGLNPDIDYELTASHEGSSSPTKTLSAFDSRKEATINLKLNPKK